MTDSPCRHFLLDVSRLLWRVWSRRLPTGIDRVCLEYVRHFRERALAVFNFRGRTFVFSAKDSDRLFGLLLYPPANVRRRLLSFAGTSIAGSRRNATRCGMIYLNVGHTGLHDPALSEWIAANGVKAVHLIHDLIPITHSQFCRAGEGDKHARRMEHALASSTGLILNSKATLVELEAFAATRGLDMPRSITAWLGYGDATKVTAVAHLDRPHFVTVGTIEARKNHILLLQVWRDLVAEMGSETPILVIIGQRGWMAGHVEAILDGDAALRPHVREVGNCSDGELVAWLRSARALLMPSLAEGFGLPVVEALVSRTPVIATNLPVYREIVGDIPTYLDAEDPIAWKAAVRAFMSDGPERDRQKRAMQSFEVPDWPSHFARVEAWLSTL